MEQEHTIRYDDEPWVPTPVRTPASYCVISQNDTARYICAFVLQMFLCWVACHVIHCATHSATQQHCWAWLDSFALQILCAVGLFVTAWVCFWKRLFALVAVPECAMVSVPGPGSGRGPGYQISQIPRDALQQNASASGLCVMTTLLIRQRNEAKTEVRIQVHKLVIDQFSFTFSFSDTPLSL